jgi:pyruvate,orthophosphate dikinase
MPTETQSLDELTVLRALGLKGRGAADAVAAATGLPPERVEVVLRSALATGAVKQVGEAFRLTPEGREKVGDLLAEERKGVDHGVLEGLYERFHAPNTRLKELMTAWQTRDGAPNDHGDRAYDDSVAAEVVALASEVEGLADDIGAAAPRLAQYPRRLRAAAARVAAGDHDFLAKPLIDSFHTVWFELHEELIALLGRNREEEARAGRAV